jgi:hypothetical protein
MNDLALFHGVSVPRRFLVWVSFIFPLAFVACDKGLNPSLLVGNPVNGPTNYISVSNLATNSVVQTGFIIGNSFGVPQVGVLLDPGLGGAPQLASGSTSWSFALPTGINAWKIGTSHVIQIGALNAGQLVPPFVNLVVIQGANHDINGDGYPDLVVPAKGWSSNQGRVYVYLWQSLGGFPSTPQITLTDPAATAQDQFGAAFDVNDVNGDGYADLVVSSPGYSGSQGRVYFFPSVGQTLSPTATQMISDPGATANDFFGLGLTLGDFNGDGAADLAVGAPGSTTAQGKVYVFSSAGTAGLPSIPSMVIADPGATANDAFGTSLANGDLNADGFSDLSVGAPGTTGNQGKGYVFLSAGTSGLPMTPTNTIADPKVTAGDLFGFNMVVGDVNGDGFADLVISSSVASTAPGQIYLYLSQGLGGLSSTVSLSLSDPTATAGDSFGYALAIGDTNGDGYQDLLVGSPGYSSGVGRVYIFQSQGSGGLPGSPTSFLSDPGTSTDYFGSWLTMSDYNGDGATDLVAGSDGYSSLQGRAYLFQSLGQLGLPAFYSTLFNDPAAMNGDQFGGSYLPSAGVPSSPTPTH